MNPRIIDGDSAAGSSSRDIIISKLTKTANTHKFAAQPPTNMFGRTASEPADRERFYEYGSPIARTTSGEGGNTNLQRSASELEESAPLVNTPQKNPYEQTTPWFTLKNEHNHNRNRNLRQRDGDALRQTKSVPGDSFTHIESSSASEEEEIQLVKAQINANRNNRAASLLNNPPDVLYKETISCFFAYNSVHKNLTSDEKKNALKSLDTALSSLLVNNPENISHIHQICELMIKFKHAQTTSDTAVNKNTILAKINDIIATNQLGIEIKDLYITMHNRSTFFRRAMPNSMFIFFKMVRFGYQNSQLDNKQQAFATKYYRSDSKLVKYYSGSLTNLQTLQQHQQEITQICELIIPNKATFINAIRGIDGEPLSKTCAKYYSTMWIRRSSSSYPQQVIGHIRQKITEFYYKLTPTEHKLIFGYMLTRQLSLYQKYKDKTHLLLEFYNHVLLSLQPSLQPEQVHYAVFKETRNNALSAAIESLDGHFKTSINKE